MNDIQRWAFIEDLFKQIAEQGEMILRLLGEPPSSALMDYAGKKQVDLFMGTPWVAFVAGPWHEDDSPHTPTNGPISDDEAKRLLEDAKEYLRQGG